MVKKEFVEMFLELWEEYFEETAEIKDDKRIVEDTLRPFMRWLGNKNRNDI